MTNENIIDEIIGHSRLTKQDQVLEIGPGFGFLTERIAEAAGEVIAVELDRRLAGYLRKNLRPFKNIKIIQADIFKLPLNDLVTDLNYLLIANLPYNITSLVFRNFLSLSPRPKRMILTIQKEVAERITAVPGKMSLLSVIVQYYAEPKIVKIVGPENFWPLPEVNSAVIIVDNIGRKKFQVNEEDFLKTVKIGFSAKRKMLINNIKNGFNISSKISQKIWEKVELKREIRPQEMSMEQWLTLSRILFDITT